MRSSAAKASSACFGRSSGGWYLQRMASQILIEQGETRTRAAPAAQPLQGRARDRGARGRPRARGRHPVVARRPPCGRGACRVRRVGQGARERGRARRHVDRRRLAAPRRARPRARRRASSCSPPSRSCCSPRSRSRRSFSTGARLARLSRLRGVDSRPCSGAWPSGKATGFGPVIPGSNPGAPAIVHP